MSDAAGLERRIVTTLFVDLVGFTPLSEALDVEDLAAVQGVYFDAVRETIARYDGTIAKYVGDAVLAMFGEERARGDEPERAVRAGLALVGAMEQANARLQLEEHPLQIRVGINTGEIVVQRDGDGTLQVLGDAVNVAARLQSAAPPGGVVVGQETALAVAHAVVLEEMDPLALKGKSEAARAHLAVEVRTDPSRDHAMGSLRAPLLGRDDELAQLLALAERDGAARALIVAPPGVGKTRLVQELLARAEGVVAARVRCRPSPDAPFEPVVALIRAALDAMGLPAGSGEIRDGLASRLGGSCSPARARVVADDVLGLLGVGSAPAPEGADQREARFDAWASVLDAVGTRAVWVVEDVHWAADDLLAFLAYLGDHPAPRGRLVVETTRPALLERARDHAAGAEVVHLPTLPPGGARELIAALVGDALGPELTAALAERSDGNPLFIEELLRSWISTGALVSDEHGFRLLASPDAVVVPTSVQSIYAAQLDDLPAPAREVARRGAVVGRRFPGGCLPTLGAGQAREGIDVLRTRALISEPETDGMLGDSHSYRHALLRDAGYASLPRSERARLHARYALWLESAAGDAAHEAAPAIAGHLVAALGEAPALAKRIDDDLDRASVGHLAVRWLLRAAEFARRTAAPAAAREMLEKALAIAERPEDRARVLGRYAELIAREGDADGADAALREAFEIYTQIRREQPGPAADVDYARAGMALGSHMFSQLRFQQGAAFLAELEEEIPYRDDLPTAYLLVLKATVLDGVDNDYPGAHDAFSRAAELAHRHGDDELRASLLPALATRSDPADPEMDAWIMEHGRFDVMASRLMRSAGDAWGHGSFDDALRFLEEAEEIAEAHRFVEDQAWIDYNRAEFGAQNGEWDRAIEAGRRAIGRAEPGGLFRLSFRTWAAMLPIADARGDRGIVEEGAAWFAENGHLLPAVPTPYGAVMVGGIELIFARFGLGPTPPVDHVVPNRSFNRTYTAMSYWSMAERVIGRWIGEDLPRARAAMEGLVSLEVPAPLTAGSIALLDARVALAEGRVEVARAQAEAALQHFRRARSPWWIAKAIRILDAAGDASDALVAEAAAIESSLGIDPELLRPPVPLA